MSEPVEPGDPQHPDAAEHAGLGDLAVRHFVRVEITMLARVLAGTLAGALPAAMLTVERRRGLADRLARRPGAVIGVQVRAADRGLILRVPDLGVVQAEVGHVVRGVVLSRREVTVPEWLSELGGLLDDLARRDETTRVALEDALT